jgi:hypothetical protein
MRPFCLPEAWNFQFTFGPVAAIFMLILPVCLRLVDRSQPEMQLARKTVAPEKNYVTINAQYVLVVNLFRERKMAFIATVSAVGTFIAATVFSLWLLRELFKGK